MDMNNNTDNKEITDAEQTTVNLYNNSVIAPQRYVFWMNDITVLYKDGGYLKFVPTSDMTRIEQLNAFTRFFIYLIALLMIFDKTDELIYIPIIGIIMVIVLYNLFEVDGFGKKKELLRMKDKKDINELQASALNYRTYQVNDNGEIVTIDIDKEEAEKYRKETEADLAANKPTEYDLEGGYLDSANKLHTGPYIDAVSSRSRQLKKENIRYSLDEMRIYERNRCRPPTVDNPFMNSLVDDFNNDAPVACNADEEDINKEMKLKFNEDMYRDIEDVFDKKNSQRQFYTIAHNIPNDQEGFARWCYKFPTTCKTDQDRCLRYEDLRTKYY